MGKKDKKKTGAGAAKTQEKTAKKELKALKKEFGEDDIDQMLSEIKKKDAEIVAITIAPCDPPTPRSNASWLASPNKELIYLFGGELYDGRNTSCYNDLLVSFGRPSDVHRRATLSAMLTTFLLSLFSLVSAADLQYCEEGMEESYEWCLPAAKISSSSRDD